MRIPLDYYRILGVPIQATNDQLSQAYHDRARQLPRSEYSPWTIESRNQLLEEAYTVLSDSQRAEYDANFFRSDEASPEASSSPEPPPAPWLDIRSEQLVGALLILQELGEYDLVLQLGQPDLQSLNNPSASSDLVRLQAAKEDLVLTLALACLELSRERWRQENYEKAGTAGEMGQDLLVREKLFPNVQAEIQADLDKLRPYRILELLALDDTKSTQRQKGLQLFTQMLQKRHGIDGTGEDGSGLSTDYFLRFVQQLRQYLSAAVQQELFEAEAKRPSAVATYLAVYALIGKGFAYREPELIVRAKKMLRRLGKRQDVYLEQASCAMLLGQTEAATLALEQSQEKEPLAFIREHSQGAPDLLPGLCLYGERWLQTEVFAHFRDLANQQVSLKDYFADESVQTYLEQLPLEAETEITTAGAFNQVESPRMTSSVARQLSKPDAEIGSSRTATLAPMSRATTAPVTQGVATREPLEASEAWLPQSAKPKPRGAKHRRKLLSLLKAAAHPFTRLAVSPPSFGGVSQQRQLPLQVPPEGAPPGIEPAQTAAPETVKGSGGMWNNLRQLARQRTSSKLSPTASKLILLGLISLVGIGALGVIYALLNSIEREPQLQIQLDEPPIPIPKPEVKTDPQALDLDRQTAQQLIQIWLTAKSQAFGSQHQIDSLSKILAPSLLALWRDRAQVLQRSNAYLEYAHRVDVRSVEVQSDRATIEAAVQESARHYKGGQLNQAQSYDENLIVRYGLVRQNNRWFIKTINVQ